VKWRRLFTMDEIANEFVDLWTGDKEAPGMHGFAELFFSDCKCDLDDKGSEFFEQNHGDRHLREDGGMFNASDLGLVEYGEIVFDGGVGSFSS